LIGMTYLQPVALLRALIAEGEECFGKRSQYLWLAVGLSDDGRNPMTTIVKHGETKCMFVLVGEDLLNDPETLTYQLAHEAIHCLGSCENTTRLEEGLATYFGIHNTKISPLRLQAEFNHLDADRRHYLADVSALLRINPAAIMILRREAIAFDQIKWQQIVELGASEELAARLCSPG
jgi:hypothetical protein